jgi:hypothetical protein
VKRRAAPDERTVGKTVRFLLVDSSGFTTTKLTPPVGSLGVPLLKVLLDGLLGVLTLGRLLEGVGRDGALEGLELESVTGREKVRVVDDLDERLDLAALGNTLLAHRLGDLEGVTEESAFGMM